MARPREVADEDILAAARQVFLEHGPGASTTLVAEQLGVSSATLFHRFGSKRELMLSALLPPPPPLERLVFQPDLPLAAQLAPLAKVLSAFPGNDARLSVLRSAGFTPQQLFARFDEPPPVSMLKALTGFFADAQAHGAMPSSTEPRHLAVAFLGATKATHFFKFFCDAEVLEDEDAYLESVVELLTRGLS